METIKLSLNAIVAMCCLVLFMTSCQDDATEVQNEQEAAALRELTPQQAQMKQLLEAAAKQLPASPDLSSARTTQEATFTYELSLDIFSFDPFAGNLRGDLLEEQTGALALMEVDSIPDFNINDPEATLYLGSYTFNDANGETENIRAISFVSSDGDEALLLETSLGNIFFNNFVLGGDFATPEGSPGAIAVSQELGDIIIVDYEATFVETEEDTPDEETETLVYDFSITATALTSRDTIDQLSGTLSIEFNDFGRIVGGSYDYTTADGSTGSSTLFGVVTGDRESFLEISDITESEIGTISTFRIPLGEESFSVTLAGVGDTDSGNAFNASFEGTLVENPS